MWRSDNPLGVTIPNALTVERLLSVVYDGPAVRGVWLMARVEVRSLTGSGSSGFKYGVQVRRVGQVSRGIQVAVAPSAVGQTLELGWCELVDLAQWDVIELVGGTTGVNTFEVVPRGLTVEIR